MDLHEYLSRPDAPTVSELRRQLVARGYDVKSDAQVRQWRYRYKGRRPSPENTIGLEIVTDGMVTRRDIYPDNWHRIWPDSADTQPRTPAAPEGSGAPAAAEAGEGSHA